MTASTQMWGADAQALENLAAAMTRVAEHLQRVSVGVSSSLHATNWRGPDGEAFVDRWTVEHRRDLDAVAAQLALCAGRLAMNARQQFEASTGGSVFAKGPESTDASPADSATSDIRKWLDPGGWGVSASDLDKIAARLQGLTPAQRHDVLAALTPEARVRLVDQIQEVRSKGGFSDEEKYRFYSLFPPKDLRLLQGESWAAVNRDLPRLEAPATGAAVILSAAQALHEDHGPAPDEIEIRALDNGRYVVVLPGVIDLSQNFETPWGWPKANTFDSARDMNYAERSAMNGSNGSQTGLNAYAFAVKQAMQSAGVPPGADVMIVGHSFGAYTAMELGADRTFNTSDAGAGYHVNITHVVAMGADTDWRLPDQPAQTHALVLNNVNDLAAQGESAIGHDPTSVPAGSMQLSFAGGTAGHGHAEVNYTDYLKSPSPQVASWLSDGGAAYDSGGARLHVMVKDAYR